MLTQYDPLAIQFMTQGQMGYMPNAQYLTPAEYGAFRTTPQGNAGIGYDVAPGWLYSEAIRNRGSLFGLPAYTFNTYNPVVNQQQYMHHINRRLYDSMAAAGATAADMGINMGLSGMAVAALGINPFTLPGVLAAGVAGTALPNMAAPFVDRVRDARAVQDITRSRIAGGRDVNQLTGMGFNARAGLDIAQFMRRAGIDDAILSGGDYRELARLGIESGLMDYAGNAQQYKDVLKKLRENLTTFMEVTGSPDFKDSLKEMKRLQDMGATIADMKGIIRKENAYSRMAGISHADMVSTYGQAGALAYSMHGLNNYQGSLEAMSNVAALTLARRQGLISEAQLARHGGISGMAQTMTEQSARVHSRVRDYMVSYFMNGNATGIDPSADLSAILESASPLSAMSSGAFKIMNPSVKANFDRKKDELYGKLMDRFGAEVLEGVAAMAAGRQMGFTGRDALRFGLTYGFGMEATIAEQKTNKLFSTDFRDQMARESRLARQKAFEEAELYNNPFRKAWRGLGLLGNTIMEATFGRAARGYAELEERAERRSAGLREAGIVHDTAGGGRRFPEQAQPSATPTAYDKRFYEASDGLTSPTRFTSYAEYSGVNDRVRISTAGETPDGRAATINRRLVRGADGALRWSGRARRDLGGMSFGRYQTTTENMVRLLSGDAELRSLFAEHGLTEEHLAGASRAASAIRASDGDFSAASGAEREALFALQNAYDAVVATERGEQLINMRTFEQTRNDNFLPAYAKVRASSPKGDLLLSDAAWQETMFGLSNLRGPSGSAGDMNAFLETVSMEDITASMADKGKRRALLDRYRRFMLERLGPTYASRFGRRSREYTAQLRAHTAAADYAADPESYKARIAAEEEAAAQRRKRAEAVTAQDAQSAHDMFSSLHGYLYAQTDRFTIRRADGAGEERPINAARSLVMERGRFAASALTSAKVEGAAEFGWLKPAADLLGLDSDAVDSARASILSVSDSAWGRIGRGLRASGSQGDFESALATADRILADALGFDRVRELKEKHPARYSQLLRDLLANRVAREEILVRTGMDARAQDSGITTAMHTSDARMHELLNTRMDSLRASFLGREQNRLLEGFIDSEPQRQQFIELMGQDTGLADVVQLKAMLTDRDRATSPQVRAGIDATVDSIITGMAGNLAPEDRQRLIEALRLADPEKSAALLSPLLRKDQQKLRDALTLGTQVGSSRENLGSRLSYYAKTGSVTEKSDQLVRLDNYMHFANNLMAYGLNSESDLENDELLDSFIAKAGAQGHTATEAALRKLRTVEPGRRRSYGLGYIVNEVADVGSAMRRSSDLAAGSIREREDRKTHEALLAADKDRKKLDTRLNETLSTLSEGIGRLTDTMKTMESLLLQLKTR